jgi:ubiquinone/menaquinone biosynthesis C-methylase UbiE
MKVVDVSLIFLWLLTTFLRIRAFSVDPSSNNDLKDSYLSRRDVLFWPVGIGGAVIYGKLVSDAAQKLSRGEMVYPDAHEQRVSSTIATAMVSSIPNKTTSITSTSQQKQQQQEKDVVLKVLEVGIGKDCRLARRGLYKKAFEELGISQRVSKVELTGTDIVDPADQGLEATRDILNGYGKDHDIDVNFDFIKGSISQRLPFDDGYFDCVISTLTLCSVDDQESAMREIRRLIRPTGGSYGYVEHTAVLPDEPYRLLDFQQQLFDPLQQVVADNCHLHRYTDRVIDDIFGQDCITIAKERFLVDGMWPVSCQTCGVVQRTKV